MSEAYIPYETFSRLEADDIISESNWGEVLDIPENKRWIFNELIASTFKTGMDYGLEISDFSHGDIIDPTAEVDAYNEGYADAKRLYFKKDDQ